MGLLVQQEEEGQARPEIRRCCVEKSINNEAHQDEIEDKDNGFFLLNIHLNTLIGTSATMVILACFCVVCFKPFLRTWQLFCKCCRASDGFDCRLGDGAGGFEMSLYQAGTQGLYGAQAQLMVRPVMRSVTEKDSFPGGFPV